MLERRYYHFLFQMNSHRKYSVRRIDYLDLSVRGRSHLVMTEEEKFIRHKKKEELYEIFGYAEFFDSLQ